LSSPLLAKLLKIAVGTKDDFIPSLSYFPTFGTLHLFSSTQRCVVINAVCLFLILIFKTQTIETQQSKFLTDVNSPRYCRFSDTFYITKATILAVK